LGDDAVLAGFTGALSSADFEVMAMSGSPDETYRNYGIPCIPRRDMSAYETALKESDALVFPGGSIFQDATSLRSVLYYRHLVKKAKQHGKKVLLLGQGVGPLKGYFAKKFTAEAFNAADGIAVRDPQSRQLLTSIGVKRRIDVAADSAFLMRRPPDLTDAAFGVGTMKVIGIAPRPVKRNKEFAGLISALCTQIYRAGFMPALVEMDRHEDGPFIDAIEKEQGGKLVVVKKLATPVQVQQRFARMEAVIAVRLHAGILASTVGVPTMMLSYDPKVAAFAKLLDFPCLAVEGLSSERLFSQVKEFIKDKDRLRGRILEKTEELRTLANVSLQVLEREMPSKGF